MALKVCFIDVIHWHSASYYRALKGLGDLVDLAAVSAGNPQTGQQVAKDLGARFYADPREMVQKERPDLVFALGRHCDMAGTARFLLEEGIAFAMEKPMGMNAGEVEELATLANLKGAFVAAPFSIRMNPWVGKIKELEGPAADISHASFRFTSGPTSRYYQTGNPWHMKKAESGGGCLINVGIHFPDLYFHLTGKKPKSVYAVTSNDVYGEEVEDFAQVTMEMVDGALCIIECSYSHAVAPWTPGFEFSLHSKRHHFRSMGKEVMTWSDQLGNPNYLEGPHGNTASYPAFVADTIDAFQNGRPPIATIEDDVASLRIVDAAYRSAASGEVVRLD